MPRLSRELWACSIHLCLPFYPQLLGYSSYPSTGLSVHKQALGSLWSSAQSLSPREHPTICRMHCSLLNRFPLHVAASDAPSGPVPTPTPWHQTECFSCYCNRIVRTSDILENEGLLGSQFWIWEVQEWFCICLASGEGFMLQ